MAIDGYSERERRGTVMALGIVIVLSALDETVVTTAIPQIISDLGGLSLFSWVTTTYLLTGTVTMPIWGKISDLYGRKPVFLASILFFLMGSCLSGLAGEFDTLPGIGNGMMQLIVFRGIQGVGAGGLFILPFTIIADLYPPGRSAKIGGVLGSLFVLSTIVGPLVGGYLTEHGTVHWLGQTIAGWRFVFYVNLPFGLLALFLIISRMPRFSSPAQGGIDVRGAILIVAAVVPLMLALAWGGHQHAWNSPLILGLLGGSVFAIAVYVATERFVAEPILPLALFRDRLFAAANAGGFLVSMSFIGAVSFLPLFIQIAHGANATAGGLTMMPMLLGIVFSATFSGMLAGRTGRLKAILLVGVTATGLAVWLMSRMTLATTEVEMVFLSMMLGIGLGPCQSLFIIAIQNGAHAHQIGVATSSIQFFRQIGATLGIALFGGIVTAKLQATTAGLAPEMTLDRLNAMVGAASRAEGSLPDVLRSAVAVAVTETFALSLLALVAAGAAILLMPTVKLRARTHLGGAVDEERTAEMPQGKLERA